MTRRPQLLATSTRLLRGVTAASVVAFAALLGLVAAHWSTLLTGDHAADSAAHVDVLTYPWLLLAARTATMAGSALVLDLIVLVVGLALLITGFWRGALLLLVARVGELASVSVVKELLARARPTLVDPVEHAAGFSFPSGHAAGSAAVYGTLVLLVLPRVARWARVLLLALGALLVAAVASSRVLLGLHYPSDVAAGAALGLAWVGAAALLAALPRLPPG